jgi:hypothetical protein
MRGGHVCVGGHDLDEGMRSLRLLRPDGTDMPADEQWAKLFGAQTMR